MKYIFIIKNIIQTNITLAYLKMTSPFNITIKEVFTANTRQYVIYKEWTTGQLLDNLYPLLSADFNIAIENVEIVGSLHINNIAVGAEYDPAINPSDITVEELWGENLTYVAFYVRNKYDDLIINPPPIQPPILCRTRRTLSLSNEINNLNENANDIINETNEV